MITVEEVYIEFRRSQSRFLSRPFRIPKNWDSLWLRMTSGNVDNIKNICTAFNTRWSNIEIDKYFDCGFQLFGNKFSYPKFFNKGIINLYIDKDKKIKRQQINIKESFENSNEFVKEWINNKKYRKDLSLYKQYCMMQDDGIRAPLKHYMKNKIDKYFIVWLMKKSYLFVEDYEKNLIPLIIENYRRYSEELNNIKMEI